jgi:UDP:flavonoid glycosyltransferase YjiC (YdhE family)
MRILMTTTRGAGHFGPLKPFADAFLADGHDVLVAAPPLAAEMVRRAGFPFRSLAAPPEEARNAVFAQTAGLGHMEANRVVIAELFAATDARAALPSLITIVDDWKPDAILYESCEFAAALAGEIMGVPTVRVALGTAALESWVGRLAAPAVDALRAQYGLPADPDGTRLQSGPTLTLAPRALEDPSVPSRGTRYRDPAMPAPAARRADGRPLVYVSFGSVAGQMGYFPSLYQAAIAELASLPVTVLLTTGNAKDPAELGPLPANVRAERWVQEHFILPHAAAMVSHGGAGSIRMALSTGVPLAVVPLFGDQPFNAHAVARCGAGVALEGTTGLGAAVRNLLADPTYAETALHIAEDIAALTPANKAIRVIERTSIASGTAARMAAVAT